MRGLIRGLALSSLMVFGCGGCSYIFVSGKPSNAESLPPSEPVECTSSKVAPVLDTVFAGLEVVRTGYALSQTEADYRGQQLSRGADIGFGAAFVALFASSAIYGYLKTGSCADAKEQQRQVRQRFLAPPPPPELTPSSAPPPPPTPPTPELTPSSAPPPPVEAAPTAVPPAAQ